MANLVYASLAIAVLVLVVLFLFGLRVQRNNVWLIGYIMVLGYSCWIGHLMQTREIFKFPHLIRTGTICGYLIVPMLFLYVRSTCYPGRIWQRWYWILFLPSIFFIIDLVPFWLLPASEKNRIFGESMRDLKSMHAFSEGWISPRGFHFFFRMVWSLFWYTAIIGLIYQNIKILGSDSEKDNKHVFRFMAGLTVLSMPFLIAHLMINLFSSQTYTLSNFTFLLALPLMMAGFYLMMFPSVVYGLRPAHGPFLPSRSMTETMTKDPEGTPKSKLDVNEHDLAYAQFTDKLLEFMTQEKPYLNPGLTIHVLAEASGIPAYIVSTLVNRNFGQSFTNWVNSYRVETFKILALRADSRSFTMESLGKAAGFGSRVTLINAFKKHTGQTPRQYFRQQLPTGWSDLA